MAWKVCRAENVVRQPCVNSSGAQGPGGWSREKGEGDAAWSPRAWEHRWESLTSRKNPGPRARGFPISRIPLRTALS